MNKWARPSEWNRAPASAGGRPFAHPVHQYFAFLSYSHADAAVADWLHGALEAFRVPPALVGRLTENGVIPKRLSPVFRDRHELAAAEDLGTEIRQALAASHFLVVLCSPAAAKSAWTNAEIDLFKRVRPDGCVIAAIVAGEPFASDIPGREHEECFPPALRHKYDRRGRPTGKRAEPLAADLRDTGDGRKLGLLKIVAGMLGIGLDDLVQRDHSRRQRRLVLIAGSSLVGMLITSSLAIAAIQARDSAREQRRQAETLVEFMLGDLKDKLEPIGKLDVLDGVGSRVLDYYSKQDTSDLSDVGLAQRSQALALMGQIAYDRGNLDRADALYRAAYAGTAEEVRRSPNDPQRLYDHAQNVFYIGEIAAMRGRLDQAEIRFRDYRRLSDHMVAVDPNNIKWRMEAEDSAANLGYVLYSRRDFAGSLQQYERALATIDGVIAVYPQNSDYQAAAVAALPLLLHAQEATGKLADAIETGNREVALLQRLEPRIGAQAHFQLNPAYRDLGRLYAEVGQNDAALQRFQAAVAEGDTLVATDPTALKWRESAELARLALAEQEFVDGLTADAAQQAPPVCSAFEQLVANGSAVSRRAGLRDCLLLEVQIALKSGDLKGAAELAPRALQAAQQIKSTDPISDRLALSRTLRLVGDTRKASGDLAGARTAWAEAEAAIPGGVAEAPRETDEHALLLERLGRMREAAPLSQRLRAMGYKQTS